MPLKYSVCAAAFAAAALLASPAVAQTYVFGDSAAEQGNLYALPGQARPGSPYYVRDGFSRESNGPVWVEYLSPGIRPVLGAGRSDTAVNFAYSGATSGVGNIAAPFETGLTRQVDAYLQRVASGSPRATADDLFIIEAGTNDFIRDLGTRDLRETSREVVDNVTIAASRLAGAGARRILVEEVPDFIRAPLFNDIVPAADRKALEAVMAQLGDAHRSAQVDALSRLSSQLGGEVDVVNVPINKLFDHILANGPALGFNVLDRACYDDETGALCSSDPAVQNSYLFFDRLHLSTRAQQLQARYYEALIDQLDGSANLVAGLAARDGLRQGADLVAAERAERLSAWLSGAPSEPGFRAIAEVSHGREDLDATGATLAARSDRDTYRLGFAYADDEGHTYRAVATRYEDDTRHALGQHQLEGWAVTLGGERRFGPLRLGASVSHMSGELTGQRDLPVALMSTRYSPKFSGEAVDLELGWAFDGDTVSVLPSTWVRYGRARLSDYAETGDTGLEMDFGTRDFEAVFGGVGVAAAYRGSGRVQPRVALTYERLIDGGRGSVTGVLIDNSANPIVRDVSTGDRDRLVIEPAVRLDLGRGVQVDLSARQVVGDDDTRGLARLSVVF